jgi:hypothetical protein
MIGRESQEATMMEGILWPVLGMVLCLTVMCAVMMAGGRLFSRRSGAADDRRSIGDAQRTQT